jgi:hypothetical protein
MELGLKLDWVILMVTVLAIPLVTESLFWLVI